MTRVVLAMIVLLLCGSALGTASAQEQRSVLVQQQGSASAPHDMSVMRLAVVGAGVVIGSVAGYYAFMLQSSVFVGGLAGGIAANWLYGLQWRHDEGLPPELRGKI
jgi:hypothetical protein